MLLPRRFNDKTPVPKALITETLLELRRHFGAVSSETQTTRGMWTNQGEVFHDDLIRVYVDVPDLAKHRAFFVRFKEQLKSRFQQLEIWLTTYPIETL